MPLFSYVVTVESSEPPTAAARAAMLAVLAEEGFVDVIDEAADRLKVAGSNPARADQLAFTLRDKLGEVWKSTTALVSEAKEQTRR